MKQYERLALWMRGRPRMSLADMVEQGCDVEYEALPRYLTIMRANGYKIQRGKRRRITTYRLVSGPKLLVPRPTGPWQRVWQLMDGRP